MFLHLTSRADSYNAIYHEHGNESKPAIPTIFMLNM